MGKKGEQVLEKRRRFEDVKWACEQPDSRGSCAVNLNGREGDRSQMKLRQKTGVERAHDPQINCERGNQETQEGMTSEKDGEESEIQPAKQQRPKKRMWISVFPDFLLHSTNP